VGPAGLMLGWYERLFHVGTIVVIQLLVYDNIKHLLLNL
jgi:solute carrier family 25 phosphate transporter 3